ncbi:hydroxymethylbilane synthase [Sporanaerobium hydrogeniformans]|uniref:Hydroxymethylbilane synthase n=1 Tax=Sporanaerobium hydrogeniformans TaxID=3072179 RepID=A0AC61DG67_9FIRM|nr:hydroxymethylbilane synthase [Sporanaerobium hydrogeniformans]PHV71845.1 hydroxymethylbilane synthase [Sporanaerobium hydrogeniformans]
MEIIVGTRGSQLALSQTGDIIKILEGYHPHVKFTLKIIKTKGDSIQHIALDQIGEKALFVKEIEEELLNGTIDFAVHSMKDMPSDVPEGLCFGPVPKREDVRDVLILKEGYKTLEELPLGARIGTGSKRRSYQLLKLRPDLEIVPIRGNIDTRIKKIKLENLEGIVLAAAGLHRLKLKEQISVYLPVTKMVPAPGQGALALEMRQEDKRVQDILAPLYDEESCLTVAAERGFMDGLNGSCHLPMGAYAELSEGRLILTGLYGDEGGKCLVLQKLEGPQEEAREIGLRLAKELLKTYEEHIK